jgi:hypothetical protein
MLPYSSPFFVVLGLASAALSGAAAGIVVGTVCILLQQPTRRSLSIDAASGSVGWIIGSLIGMQVDGSEFHAWAWLGAITLPATYEYCRRLRLARIALRGDARLP